MVKLDDFIKFLMPLSKLKSTAVIMVYPKK